MTASAVAAAAPPTARPSPARMRRDSALAAAIASQPSDASPKGPVSASIDSPVLCAQVRMGNAGSTRS